MALNERCVVIGAGAAGLSAALALVAAGREVVLLEAADAPGGKIRSRDGVAAGPTVFTMAWVFDELFASLGERLEDWLTLAPLAVLARHAWDGAPDARLDLHADLERSVDAIGAFAGRRDAEGYRAFAARAAAIYEHLERRFIAADKPTPAGMVARLGARRTLAMLALSPPRTLWSTLGGHFRDPRLRQLFARYATYCGSSPFLAPSTLMLVAHVERLGVSRLTGGMTALPQALARLAAAKGVALRYNAPAAAIETALGRVSGVRLRDGERIAAGAVVFAGDPSALGQGLLGEPARAAAPSPPRLGDRSLSALVVTARARARGFPLAHHTVFFSKEYAREFNEIFRDRRLPTEPTTYVCAEDRADAEHRADARSNAVDGFERLQILVNAPALGDRPLSDEEIASCRDRTLALLARTGLTLEIESAQTTTPTDFATRFPGSAGALYGPANHSLMATFARPGARTRLPGLYLASGAAHPGPGVPMAALSGRLAAAALTADWASTKRRRPAATSGGMSTA